MTAGNQAALQMLITTYDEVFLDTPQNIKLLLEEIYEGIQISEEEITNFLNTIDYESWRTRRDKTCTKDSLPL